MVESHINRDAQYILERGNFQNLLDALAKRKFKLYGPMIRDKAIGYDEIANEADLPIGWSDEQEGGKYRLKKRYDNALFGYSVGISSWKKFLFPSERKLWEANRNNGTIDFNESNNSVDKMAFIGVRSCELHAIEIQDKIFRDGDFKDSIYKTRREQTFVLAVNCGYAGGNCFCVSMRTGPKVYSGFDLALTEIIKGDRHYFLVNIGSDIGAEVFSEIPFRLASEDEKRNADEVILLTAGHMGKTLNTEDIKNILNRNFDHPRWDVVAARCLACSNCTMVCPTCFCSSAEDSSDLTGSHAERWRKWDSCFSIDFSYIHGGKIRYSSKSRYRQWMTHKLANWIDQFGMSGCVGCGRCITWCPVAIDITEEAQAIRDNDIVNAATMSMKEK